MRREQHRRFRYTHTRENLYFSVVWPPHRISMTNESGLRSIYIFNGRMFSIRVALPSICQEITGHISSRHRQILVGVSTSVSAVCCHISCCADRHSRSHTYAQAHTHKVCFGEIHCRNRWMMMPSTKCCCQRYWLQQAATAMKTNQENGRVTLKLLSKWRRHLQSQSHTHIWYNSIGYEQLLSWVSESDIRNRVCARVCVCSLRFCRNVELLVVECRVWCSWVCVCEPDRITSHNVMRICNIFTFLVCFITFHITRINIISFTYSFLFLFLSVSLSNLQLSLLQSARPAIFSISLLLRHFSVGNEACVFVSFFCLFALTGRLCVAFGILTITHHKENI